VPTGDDGKEAESAALFRPRLAGKKSIVDRRTTTRPKTITIATVASYSGGHWHPAASVGRNRVAHSACSAGAVRGLRYRQPNNCHNRIVCLRISASASGCGIVGLRLCDGVFSSRKLERATYNWVALRIGGIVNSTARSRHGPRMRSRHSRSAAGFARERQLDGFAGQRLALAGEGQPGGAIGRWRSWRCLISTR
jgi:hypothetical protein